MADTNVLPFTLPTSNDDPSTVSLDYKDMADDWRTISDILTGLKAIREGRDRYLPRYPGELADEYERRLKMTPWRAEFDDALRTLASKPFERKIALLGEDVPQEIKDLYENIDARGNDLTAFCRDPFKLGIAKGYHGIFVDYPNINPQLTVRQEREVGARPYWISLRAEDILSVRTEVINGVEEVMHLRFKEASTEKKGKFGEERVESIRSFDRADNGVITWETYRKTNNEWKLYQDGVMQGQDKIPISLWYSGDREGPQKTKLPMKGLADMQLELYRALSRKDEIETYAGSPMLEGKGITPPGPTDDQILVGPKRILLAPPAMAGGQTGWTFIQPDAANMREIRESVKDLIDDLRRLGLQPMTQRSGGITATATSIDGAKAHTTIEAWCVLFRDAIERAWEYTCKWIKSSYVVAVHVHTDFSVLPYEQVPMDNITKARERGDVSVETFWDTSRRFDVLPPDFDPDVEKERITAEKEQKFKDQERMLETAAKFAPKSDDESKKPPPKKE